jgi:hypothetical protein
MQARCQIHRTLIQLNFIGFSTLFTRPNPAIESALAAEIAARLRLVRIWQNR